MKPLGEVGLQRRQMPNTGEIFYFGNGEMTDAERAPALRCGLSSVEFQGRSYCLFHALAFSSSSLLLHITFCLSSLSRPPHSFGALLWHSREAFRMCSSSSSLCLLEAVSGVLVYAP